MASSRADTVNLNLLPLALSLPPELWISILRRLNYSQLKKASRICKKIQKYILGKEFDAVLFRQGLPKPQLQDGDKLEVHPFLQNVDCVSKDWETMMVFVRSDGNRHTPTEYPSILNEYATSPASSMSTLIFPTGRTKPLSKMKGARVIDILKWAAKYWKPIDFDRRLGDHRFFEGWDDVRSRGQGQTELTCYGFGS
ncbi:hypothetical protein JCM16303_004652 [Sporobolomyces ruberrimus]